MCLQWCHVTHQIIDNDFPCAHCPPPVRYAHAGRECDGCRHFVEAARLCALTHTDAPLSACCHYDTLPDCGERTIRPGDVAIGLLARYRAASVAEMFARSETAPEVPADASGNIRLDLADLAVPEVYGLPADEWDAALGRPPLPALDWDALPWPEIEEEKP